MGQHEVEWLVLKLVKKAAKTTLKKQVQESLAPWKQKIKKWQMVRDFCTELY